MRTNTAREKVELECEKLYEHTYTHGHDVAAACEFTEGIFHIQRYILLQKNTIRRIPCGAQTLAGAPGAIVSYMYILSSVYSFRMQY